MVIIAYLSIADPIYTATAQMLLEPQGQVSADGVDADRALPPETMDALAESQLRIIESLSVLDRVVRGERLVNDPEFLQSDGLITLASNVFSTTRVPTGKVQGSEYRALRALQRTLTTKRPAKTFVIDISVSTKDPIKSARLANAVASGYLAEQAAAYAAEAQDVANSLSAQLPSLRAQVQLTEDLISTFRFQHDLTVLPGTLSLASSEALAELRDLERGLEATRTVYQSFLVRARRAAEEARVTRTGARIISVAYPPSAPSWPLRGLLVSLGAFAGFALGTSFALARDHFDQRLFTKRQVEERTGQPVLSVIPTLDLAKSGARHLHNGPFLRLLDAIRENSIGGPARVVLITSGGAAEGTSSLALNLSAAAADEGERVLLISDELVYNTTGLRASPGFRYDLWCRGLEPVHPFDRTGPASRCPPGTLGSREGPLAGL